MDWDTVRTKFKQVWGYDDFRPPQGEVIANLLARQDSMVILATGSGKSICFQLPALLQNGLTLVVSPLLSLIEDQVKDLQSRNLAAAALHSSLSSLERKQVFKRISSLRLLYLSPETLLSKPVWERLSDPDLVIVGMMIDEAHCLGQWGDSFRPDYRRLGVVRSALMTHKPASHGNMAIAAFTATADPKTQSDLKSCLKLHTPQLIRTSPYRSNLSLNVAIAWTMAGRKSQTLKFIQAHKGQSGLIYVRSRRDTEELAEWLKGQSFLTSAYHAGLPSSEKREIERKWLVGGYPFVIASSAFGLGTIIQLEV
ncbi:ATP-dependent DNA helicase, RecQ family [Synechococcus sp. PCC 7502]|uniref:RecQ family ATP-dependent DNA helicase n=1 Tax=Synechococcus sp. PCC 7502 TaxID=1173263 RepID=UPI00029FE1E0|nr:RecQ family ATP-dependent DNA helicase [Synechococcus sp. PCC 7502]AFY74742.1 ATP-dependent DNA helicase, RecQ family [Synechococcus sp. PCC 7502]